MLYAKELLSTQTCIVLFHLCCKYRIAHADWNNNVNFLMKKICVKYTNHDYSVCNTVRELCDIRDGVKQCDYFDNAFVS